MYVCYNRVSRYRVNQAIGHSFRCSEIEVPLHVGLYLDQGLRTEFR